MVKFSSEFRGKAVFRISVRRRRFRITLKKYGIGSYQTTLNWVNRYKEYGERFVTKKYETDGTQLILLCYNR